jgi:hypothetical protein
MAHFQLRRVQHSLETVRHPSSEKRLARALLLLANFGNGVTSAVRYGAKSTALERNICFAVRVRMCRRGRKQSS